MADIIASLLNLLQPQPWDVRTSGVPLQSAGAGAGGPAAGGPAAGGPAAGDPQVGGPGGMQEPQFYPLLPPYGWAGQSQIGGRDANVGTPPFFPAQGGPPPMTLAPRPPADPYELATGGRLYSGGPEAGFDWRDYRGNPSTRGGFFTIADLVNSGSPLVGSGLNAMQAQWDSPSTNNWRLLGGNPNMIMRNGYLIDRSKQLDEPIPVWHGGANPDAGGGTYGRTYGGQVGYPAFTAADFGSGWGYWPGAFARANFSGAVT